MIQGADTIFLAPLEDQAQRMLHGCHLSDTDGENLSMRHKVEKRTREYDDSAESKDSHAQYQRTTPHHYSSHPESPQNVHRD